MFQELRACIGILIFTFLVAGVGYPLLINEAGQDLFPNQANGSIVKNGEAIIGSELIGQNFSNDRYFHPRPSAAGGGYDAGYSSGSNLAPSSRDLIKTISARVNDLRTTGEMRPIPVDLVTSSGSGLDPDISVASAEFQAARVATARNVPLPQIEAMIASNTKQRTLGILGEKRVNVLAINRALDDLPEVANAQKQKF